MLVQKIRYRLVYNRKKKINAQGTALVQIEAKLNDRRVYFSTNMYLKPEHWCKDGAQVVNHPQSHELNSILWQNILELQALELSYYKRGLSNPLSKMKEDVSKGARPVVSFTKYMDTCIDRGNRKDSTKENIRTTVKILKEYKRMIEFADINVQFLRDFEQYLANRGLKVNTVHKHMRQLRTMVNEAIRDGYIPKDAYPYDGVKLKKEKTEHKNLTVEQLRKLERMKIDDKKPSQRRVLDAFLFCCYTGLRYSDFVCLREEHFVTKDGKPWLVMKSRKTGVRVDIPLSVIFRGKALNILGRYGSLAEFVDIGSNEATNRVLKQLMGGISFHWARHTCATMLLNQGVPITTVQSILGHTSVKTTQIYAAVLNDTIVRDLTKANKKVGKEVRIFGKVA